MKLSLFGKFITSLNKQGITQTGKTVNDIYTCFNLLLTDDIDDFYLKVYLYEKYNCTCNQLSNLKYTKVTDDFIQRNGITCLTSPVYKKYIYMDQETDLEKRILFRVYYNAVDFAKHICYKSPEDIKWDYKDGFNIKNIIFRYLYETYIYPEYKEASYF